jgi:hypothetical protein
MKKFITPFLLLSLTLAAAPPVNITNFTVTCSSLVTSGCDQPTFTADGIDPTVSYQIDGIGPNPQSWPWASGQGTSINLATNSTLDPGSWTFEIHAIGRKGNETNKVLATYSATY